MKIALAALLWICQAYAADQTYKPSEACLAMQGKYEIRFHGEVFPFSMNTYTIELLFEPNKQGLSFSSNHRDDLRLIASSQTLNSEDLTEVFDANTLFSEQEVHDCFIEPDRCVKTASEILKDLKLAEAELVSTADEPMRSALQCGIERVRFFTKKVRDEVRSQKVLPRYE